MTVFHTAAGVAAWVVGFLFAANAVRWYMRGIATWYRLSDLLAETGEKPLWEPRQPGLGHGLWLLRHPPGGELVDERDRLDVEGRTAVARAWLWFAAGVAVVALFFAAG